MQEGIEPSQLVLQHAVGVMNLPPFAKLRAMSFARGLSLQTVVKSSAKFSTTLRVKQLLWDSEDVKLLHRYLATGTGTRGQTDGSGGDGPRRKTWETSWTGAWSVRTFAVVQA